MSRDAIETSGDQLERPANSSMRWAWPALAILAMVGAFAVGRLSNPHGVVRTFWGHRTAFQHCADEAIAGRLAKRTGETDFVVPADLRSLGVAYVRMDGTCVTFLFQSLPPDAIEQLVFSPDGYSALNLRPKAPDGQNTVIELHMLDDHWFYLVRN